MKTIRIPRSDISPNQLFDEILSAFPQHRGTKGQDGIFRGLQLGLAFNEKDIFIHVPDSITQAQVDTVISTHTPRPFVDHRKNALQKIRTMAGLTEEETNAL